MADVGLIPDGAIAIAAGQIVAVGPSADLQADYTARETIDASGKVICPGFVDPHTHVVYAGDRVNEFELRIRGATYMEIMEAGGGIVNTMRALFAQQPVGTDIWTALGCLIGILLIAYVSAISIYRRRFN